MIHLKTLNIRIICPEKPPRFATMAKKMAYALSQSFHKHNHNAELEELQICFLRCLDNWGEETVRRVVSARKIDEEVEGGAFLVNCQPEWEVVGKVYGF